MPEPLLPPRLTELLSALSRGPATPAQLRLDLPHIPRSTLYDLCRALHRRGYAAVTRLEAAKQPLRTRYRVTKAGESALRRAPRAERRNLLAHAYRLRLELAAVRERLASYEAGGR